MRTPEEVKLKKVSLNLFTQYLHSFTQVALIIVVRRELDSVMRVLKEFCAMLSF